MWTKCNRNPPVDAEAAGASPGSLHQINKDVFPVIAEEMTEKK